MPRTYVFFGGMSWYQHIHTFSILS